MSPSTTTTSRWSPTPEQLMILEEMYKGGLRTPNATQIQKITSHLSFYGKIEGKNVFYWFQNHKARDRQKLRKKLILTKQLQLQQKFSQNSNIIINNYASSSDDVVLGLIDPSLPPPPPPPPHLSVAGIHLHALHHEYDRYAEYLRLQGGTDDDGGTARLTSNGGDDDWMMMMTMTKKTVSSSSMTRDINAPVGPTCTLPCCTMTYHNNNNNRPLKTLELFPVTSPNLIKQHQINIDGANTEVIFDL